VGTKENNKRQWMKEWFKKPHVFNHEDLLKELGTSEPGVYT
jgi:hypothetical protein